MDSRPIVRRAIISERPSSARCIPPQRWMRGSLQTVINSSISSNVKCMPCLQDIGTSTFPAKFEDPEITTLPIRNITFELTPASSSARNRKVIVLKYLKTPTDKHPKKLQRSMLRFFNLSSQDHSKRNSICKTSSGISTRPATSKSTGPITKRVLSELNFDHPPGSRLFDIREVLSVAQGEINLKNLKYQSNLK